MVHSSPVDHHEEVRCQIPAQMGRFVVMMLFVVVVVVGLTIAVWADLDFLSFEPVDTVVVVVVGLAVVVVAVVVGYTSSLAVDHKIAVHTYVVQPLDV